MSYLRIFDGNRQVMDIDIFEGITTLGRDPENVICIPDPTISRKQFSIESQGESWSFKDCSGNGTDVSGENTLEANIINDTEIKFSTYRVIFRTMKAMDSSPVFKTQKYSAGNTGKLIESKEAPEPKNVILQIINNDYDERSVPFTNGMIIGANEDCDLVLRDRFVSSKHLRIEKQGKKYCIIDLKSKNGTYLGKVRVEEIEVPLECVFKIGRTELVLRAAPTSEEPYIFEGMVGDHPSMMRIYEMIKRVAPSPTLVSIFGETGTGKELVAKAIHKKSKRNGLFLPINCAAIPKDLFESELFGHEKGAFTGAMKTRIGAFEQAHGGTLFLDEIGELPLVLQAQLLRVIEDNIVKRLGSSKSIKVDTRLVVATNRDLRKEAKRGAFREDLFWRLNVVSIELPPLRARRSDLPSMIKYFYQGRPKGTSVSMSAESKLSKHDWPGNVRELKNTIHRSLYLCKDNCVDAEHIQYEQEFVTDDSDNLIDDHKRIYIHGKTQEQVIDEMTLKFFRLNNGIISRTSKALGISRATIYRRLSEMGVNLNEDERKLIEQDSDSKAELP